MLGTEVLNVVHGRRSKTVVFLCSIIFWRWQIVYLDFFGMLSDVFSHFGDVVVAVVLTKTGVEVSKHHL